MGQVLPCGVGRLGVRVFFEDLFEHRPARGDIPDAVQLEFGQAELPGQPFLAGSIRGLDDLFQQARRGGLVFEVVGLDLGLQQQAFEVARELQ